MRDAVGDVAGLLRLFAARGRPGRPGSGAAAGLLGQLAASLRATDGRAMHANIDLAPPPDMKCAFIQVTYYFAADGREVSYEDYHVLADLDLPSPLPPSSPPNRRWSARFYHDPAGQAAYERVLLDRWREENWRVRAERDLAHGRVGGDPD